MDWDSLIRIAELLLAPVFVLGGLATFRNPQSRADQLARLRCLFRSSSCGSTAPSWSSPARPLA